MATKEARRERDFYNEEIKYAYLEHKLEEFQQNNNLHAEDQCSNIARILEKMKRFETENGKDASCFTSLEIKDAFKQLNFVSVYMAANFRSQLSNYTQIIRIIILR